MKPESVLQSLLADLRAGHFRPRAIRRFLRDGIRHGISLAWGLRDLRYSFYASSAVMFAVLVLLGSVLEVLAPAGLSVQTWVATGALFLFVFGLTLLQLGLVRAESSGQVYDRFVFPNVLTLLRLLMIPYIAEALGMPPGTTGAQVAFALIIGAGLTDTLDGTLSRRLGLTSDFGRIYDPVVDAAFHSVIAVALYRLDGAGALYAGSVLVRYLFPPVAVSMMYLFREPFHVKATVVGKASSLMLSVYVCTWSFGRALDWPELLAFCRAWLEPLSVAACLVTLASFIARGIRMLSHRTDRVPTKRPTRRRG